MSRPAVFLDRDGTLLDDPGYLADAAAVRLLPGAAEALRCLEAAGYARIVITNQSGIGRGLITEAQYQDVTAAFEAALREVGVSVTAIYHCPHRPDEGCACRKPGTRLHREAAATFDIDLARSWCVGDRPGDLLPATALGCRAALVLTGDGAAHADAELPPATVIAGDIFAAVERHILG